MFRICCWKELQMHLTLIIATETNGRPITNNLLVKGEQIGNSICL